MFFQINIYKEIKRNNIKSLPKDIFMIFWSDFFSVTPFELSEIWESNFPVSELYEADWLKESDKETVNDFKTEESWLVFNPKIFCPMPSKNSFKYSSRLAVYGSNK